VQRYDGDPVRDLLDVVRREYGMPPATPFQAVGVDAGPVGPGRHRSPYHRLPFDSINEQGSQMRWMKWRAIYILVAPKLAY